jgi:hypothetical protein
MMEAVGIFAECDQMFAIGYGSQVSPKRFFLAWKQSTVMFETGRVYETIVLPMIVDSGSRRHMIRKNAPVKFR